MLFRSLRGSSKYPWFDEESLTRSLEERGIRYTAIPELAGLRKKNKDSVNTIWRNLSFRAYADYMETPEFLQGIGILTEIATKSKTAIMCAEAVWWRCHRSMIADYMKSIGWEVIHILTASKSEIHTYTAAASIREGKLYYGRAKEPDQ